MICSKCGNTCDESVKFCPECGAPVAAEAAEQAPEERSVGAETATEQNSQIPSAGAAAFYGTPAPEEAPGRAPRKKKKGLIALILILVVAAAAGVFAALRWNMIRNWWNGTFASPADHFRAVCDTAIDDLAKNAPSLSPLSGTEKGGREERTVSLAFSPDLTGVLQNGAGVDLSWLKSVSVATQTSAAGGEYAGTVALRLNDVDILSGAYYLERETMVLHARIDQISDEYFRLDLAGFFDQMAAEEDGISPSSFLSGFLSLPSYEKSAAILSRYGKSALRALDDKAVEREKNGELTVDGVTEKGTWFTVVVDGEQGRAIVSSLLEEAAADDELYGIACAFFAEGAAPSRETFQESLKTLLEETGDLGDEPVSIRVFVAADGTIHGVEETFGGSTVSYLFPRSGGKFGYSYRSAVEGEEVAGLYGSGSEKNDRITGELVMTMGGEKFADVSVERLDVSLRNMFFVNGTVTIRLGGEAFDSMINEILDGSDIDLPRAALKKIAFKIEGDCTSSGGTIKCSLCPGGNDLFTVLEEVKNSKDPAIEPVEGGMDISEYGEKIASFKVLMKIVANLEEAGVPTAFFTDLMGQIHG